MKLKEFTDDLLSTSEANETNKDDRYSVDFSQDRSLLGSLFENSNEHSKIWIDWLQYK